MIDSKRKIEREKHAFHGEFYFIKRADLYVPK